MLNCSYLSHLEIHYIYYFSDFPTLNADLVINLTIHDFPNLIQQVITKAISVGSNIKTGNGDKMRLIRDVLVVNRWSDSSNRPRIPGTPFNVCLTNDSTKTFCSKDDQ